MESQTLTQAPPEKPPPPRRTGVGTAEEPPDHQPWWLRMLVGMWIFFLGMLLIAALLYNFGSMWPPTDAQRSAYAEAVAQRGGSPHVERQFHIPVPGCVCHSDDPVTVIRHESRRISECMGCHGGR